MRIRENSTFGHFHAVAAQKLTCREIGIESTFQSVLNFQKKVALPIKPVMQDHVQLLHDESNHWFLSFYSSGRVQIRVYNLQAY